MEQTYGEGRLLACFIFRFLRRPLEAGLKQAGFAVDRDTQPQGDIEVGIQAAAEQIILSVRDDGPGLSDQDKERVLHRFYRVEDNGTSGLGLSIVERIAQVHRATVEMEAGLHGTGLGVNIFFPK